MSVPYIGTWVVNNNARPMRLQLIDRRTRGAFDLTTYEQAQLLAVSKKDPAKTINLTMTIVLPPTLGVVELVNFMDNLVVNENQEIFEADIELTDTTANPDAVITSDPFQFGIRKRRL